MSAPIDLDPHQFSRCVDLSGAAYPHNVRIGAEQGTRYEVDHAEIASYGVELIGNWHHDDTDTEFYAGYDRARAIQIVFRGTTTLRDWKSNLRHSLVPWNAGIDRSIDLRAGRVHGGHYACCRAVAPLIQNILSAYADDMTVRVDGHSLGGSEATIVAIAIACRYPDRNVILSTIGAPRSGDAQMVAFAASLPNLVIRRYYHALLDTVVLLPPWLQGYRHLPGMPIWAIGGHLVSSYEESRDNLMRALNTP